MASGLLSYRDFLEKGPWEQEKGPWEQEKGEVGYTLAHDTRVWKLRKKIVIIGYI